MDGRSPLEIELPGPLNLVKKPLLKAIKGTLVEKVLRDHDVIKDYMVGEISGSKELYMLNVRRVGVIRLFVLYYNKLF